MSGAANEARHAFAALCPAPTGQEEVVACRNRSSASGILARLNDCGGLVDRAAELIATANNDCMHSQGISISSAGELPIR